ncbi:MAG: sarcosine oxidase subunit gamma family protein [Paracoccaceae bacterium]
MSNAVSALGGKVQEGAVRVRETGLRGMISLRGDLSDTVLRACATDLTGVAFPQAGQAMVGADKGLVWMSPDEILILTPYSDAQQTVDMIQERLKGIHFLATNVSDARSVIAVEGPFVREVVAKLAPVDLHPHAFAPGSFYRSRLGQVAAAFWMRDDENIEVMTFRSTAAYAFGLLAKAAEGGAVGHLVSNDAGDARG